MVVLSSYVSSFILLKLSFIKRKLLGFSVYEYSNSNMGNPRERTDGEYKIDFEFAPRIKRSSIVSLIPLLTAFVNALSSVNCSITAVLVVAENDSVERALRRYRPVSLCLGRTVDLSFCLSGTAAND